MPKRTVSDIIRAAADAADAADRVGEVFGQRLSAVLRRTERALPDIIQSTHGAESVASAVGASRGQIRLALRRAGFDALAQMSYGETLDAVIQRVLDLRRALGTDAAMPPAIARQLEAFGTLYQIDLLAEGDVVARALWKAAIRGVFGGANLRDTLDELARVLDRTEPQIRTLYDTSVSIIGRQVEALQAPESDATVFAFLGPIDAKTRPWCLDHVGKVYTRREIDAMDNGQVGPVFLTGGGYNCRHVFSEISKASELHDLVGTGKRIPEFDAEVRRHKAAA